MNLNGKIIIPVWFACLLAAGTAQAQTPIYDSSAHQDFAAPGAAVAAGQTLANGWTDLQGGVYAVADGSLAATSSDTTGYLHDLALRPAGETSGTPNVQGTIYVSNGFPSPGTANGLVLRFQPDGTFYLFQLSSDTLYVYKISKGSAVTRLQALPVHPDPANAYSLTGSVMTTAPGVSLSVSALDTKTGKSIGSVRVPDYSDPILNAGQDGVDSWVGSNAGGSMTASYSRIVFSPLAAPLASAAFPKIGFIGDSITAGYNQAGSTITPGINDVAALTIKMLASTKDAAHADEGVSWDAYDQGVSGASTRDWRPGDAYSRDARAKTAFSLAFGTPDPKTNPVWVLLMLGTNDVRSDNHFTAEQHRDNLQAITDDLVAGGYNVILNHPPPFVVPTSFNGVTWDAASLSLLQSYLPVEQALAASYARIAPGRVFMGDTSAFDTFAAQSALFQEYGRYGGLHPNGSGGTAALAASWVRSFQAISHQINAPPGKDKAKHGKEAGRSQPVV